MSVQRCRVGVRPWTYWIIQCFTALHYNISRIRFSLFLFLPGNYSFVIVPDPKVPGDSTKNTPSHNHQPSAQAINATQTKTFVGVFVEPRSTFHLKFDFGWRGFSEESQLTWNPPYLRRYGKERKVNSIWKRVCVGFGKECPGLASASSTVLYFVNETLDRKFFSLQSLSKMTQWVEDQSNSIAALDHHLTHTVLFTESNTCSTTLHITVLSRKTEQRDLKNWCSDDWLLTAA